MTPPLSPTDRALPSESAPTRDAFWKMELPAQRPGGAIVCMRHPTVELTDVREIRADIGRPAGATVIGKCTACIAEKPRSVEAYSYGA